MPEFDTVNAYNSYNGLSFLSYNIITLLFKNEKIWKLLYYSDPNALSEPDLTPQQKRDMIWAGQENQEDYAVYLVPLAENIEYNSKVILKLYCVSIEPQRQVIGQVFYAMEIMCQSRVSMLADRRSRIEVLLEEILKTVNGAEINGTSELFFNNDMGGSIRCGTDMAIDQKRNYCGYVTVFGVHFGNVRTRQVNLR